MKIKIIDKIKRVDILLISKSGLGSAIAILIANKLNLLYSTSAGIITLLTIQNTRKETIFIALRRIGAFFVAVVLAYIIFSSFSYTIVAFGLFVFIFVAVANILNLDVGVIMNAVLVTHFLVEQRMDISLIINEALILLIGMSIGIFVNLYMRNNIEKIKRDQKIVEDKMKKTLSCMARMLKGEEDCHLTSYGDEIDFKKLDKLIERLLTKAYEDADNNLLRETRYQVSYLEMRKYQVVILKDIYQNIKEIHDVLPQALELSRYMNKASLEFTEDNNVKDLLTELEDLYEFFRKESLPVSRKEFENRAILFNISKDLKQFLEIKRSFMESE